MTISILNLLSDKNKLKELTDYTDNLKNRLIETHKLYLEILERIETKIDYNTIEIQEIKQMLKENRQLILDSQQLEELGD